MLWGAARHRRLVDVTAHVMKDVRYYVMTLLPASTYQTFFGSSKAAQLEMWTPYSIETTPAKGETPPLNNLEQSPCWHVFDAQYNVQLAPDQMTFSTVIHRLQM